MGSDVLRLARLTLLVLQATNVFSRIAFEKLTDIDFTGTAYYTVRNLSLYECQGWCREEADCQAASFSFVLNPLTPIQETRCLLQNHTEANNPMTVPQRAVNTYYMVKLQVRTESVCLRPWAFERVPGKSLRGLDNTIIYTSTKEACLAACLNEVDRHEAKTTRTSVLGLTSIAHFVFGRSKFLDDIRLNSVRLILQVTSGESLLSDVKAVKRLKKKRYPCRSAEYEYSSMRCSLSDSDRRTAQHFVELANTPGTDYFENLCLKASQACKAQRVFTAPRVGVAEDKVAQYAGLHYYTDKELQVTSESACRLACEIESEFLCRSFLYLGAPHAAAYNCRLYHLDHHTLPDGPSAYLNGERPLIDDGEPIGRYFENFCEKPPNNGNDLPLTIEHQQDSGLSSNLTRNDNNCDKTGTCYDVSVHCKDTKIAVQVRTNKPFNGRIYALGRSETCNIDVLNSDLFRLDLTMAGQDCNTQSVTGVFSNTVVLQHHSVVMTKADKIYKVKCTYDMSSKNITFGMVPIRDPEMISITAAPEAPPPRIRILDARQREVETVRIGDSLTFRIEIPEDTPYGIFARSCVAMAKDSKTTYQIIDDDGCPADPSIFPAFTPDGNALQSVYEAFRFTESYGVIFQCNVKYCLGRCEPAVCDWGRESLESWGRRKRSLPRNETGEPQSHEEDMNISQEILVLDFGDDRQSTDFLRSDKPGGTASEANYGEKTVTIVEPCPSKASVLLLGVACAMLVLLYIATIFCYYMRKWLTPPKHMP